MTQPSHSSSDELLSVGAAARALGVSVDTVRRWEDSGLIKGRRTAGGQRRYPRSEIDRLQRA